MESVLLAELSGAVSFMIGAVRQSVGMYYTLCSLDVIFQPEGIIWERRN